MFRKKSTRSSRDYSDDEEISSISSVNDSDMESETDPTDYDVNYKIQSFQSTQMREFNDFFIKDPKIINASGDPTTNIVDRLAGKCYNIPEKKLPIMFKLMESCRRGKMKMMITEKQLSYSGIMLDFDIYQDTEEDQLTDEIFHLLKISTIFLPFG